MTRLEFHEVLCGILGTRNVYFQPPESIKLHYPCIVYSLSKENTDKADDANYKKHKAYMVIVMDEDPDSEIPDKIGELEYCSFDRSYSTSGLNHWAYIKYL